MGVLTFDAAMLRGDDAGAGVVEDAGSVPDAGIRDGGAPDAGPIGTSPEGVLTNRPEVSFINTGAPDLVITTAALRMWRRTNDWALVWAGDYENRGTHTYCVPSFDVLMHGVDILTVAEGPMYAISSSIGVSRYHCLAAGDRGVFYGIETELPETFLDGLTTIYYEPSALVRNEAYPDPARPALLDATVVPNAEGEWVVESRFRTSGTPIYNFGVNFLPRIGGLLWHQFRGFHLDDVSAFTEFTPMVYSGYEQPYTEFAVSIDYLVRQGAGLVDVDDEDFRALSAWRADRNRALRALDERP